MAQAGEAAPPERPWVILASVPAVVDAAFFRRGVDISVDVKKPPRVSVLKVVSRLIPDIPVVCYPYIAAADPSGRLLLCASHLSDKWHRMIPGDHELRRILDLRGSYYLCDTYILTATRLPDRSEDDGPILHSGNVGLIRGDDGRFMVAELQPMARPSEATLLCHLAGADGWVSKKLPCILDPEHPISGWGNNGVVSNDGQLWWVDLSYGLLTCDPFDKEPDLLYVPLPAGCVVPAASRIPDDLLDLEKIRCVEVSGGRLRYVQIGRGRDHGGASRAVLIRMWTLTLDDPDGGNKWTLQYAAPFAAIWRSKSYRETGLRRELPAIALIHPRDPEVIYFWLDKSIFAVRVTAAEVLSCEHFDNLEPNLPEPLREFPSSRLVQAWEPPLRQFPSSRDHDESGGSLSSRTNKRQRQASSASPSALVE